MGSLIEDLLQLSRVFRVEIKHVTVDLSAMVEQILSEFKLSDPKRNVECIIEQGLTVYGDAGLMQIMLQNLLDNAWNFTSRKVQARIKIGSMEKYGK